MTTTKMRIPIYDWAVESPDKSAVNSVLDSGWLTMGDVVEAFEHRFGEMLGTRNAIAVSNCSMALLMVNRVLGLGAGDEVIVPSLTFVAAANSIHAVGAEPVFADISGDGPWVTAETIERCITPRTRAISIMHYSGYPCDLDPIVALARDHNLPLIEDAAHAPCARYDGKACGTFGRVGVFSFYSNKNLTTGEGGMIVTDDADLAEQFELMRNHGITASTMERHRGRALTYDVIEFGFNARMDEIRAALGCSQLDRLESGNRTRAGLVERYRELLADIPGIRPIDRPLNYNQHHQIVGAHHIMPVLLDEQYDRNEVRGILRERGIGTSWHYPPIHTTTKYRGTYTGPSLTQTDRIAPQLMTVPLYPSMPEKSVKIVCEEIDAVLRGLDA